MSSDDPEIIPPRKSLPAKRDEKQTVSIPRERLPPDPGGVVSSALTGFAAKMQARAFGEIANNIRAHTDVLNAETTRRQSALKLLRTTHELEEAPDILALDRAERNAERAARYAALEGQYDKLGEDRSERAHKGELTKLRRDRELQQAKRDLVEQNRDLFNSEQGLENQERLKDRNLRIWDKRREAQEIDAHVETERVRAELRGGNAPPIPQSSMESMRAKAEEALMTALADGNDAEADRWQRVLDALGD